MSERNTLWYTRCPVPTPLGIAAQLGWLEETFARSGFTIQSIAESNDPAIRRSHFDHHLAWSFRQGGSIPPIWARAKGRATRLVGITWTDEFQALITLPQTGVRAARDLAGRRFGIPRRDNAVVDHQRATALKGLASALSLEGLSPDDVEIVALPTPDTSLIAADDPSLFCLRRRIPYASEVAALVRDEVDAIFVKGTQGIAVANSLAAVTVSEFGFHPDPRIRINTGSPRVLTVDETFAAERPDLVAQLIAVIARVGRWAAAHPEETCRYIAREAAASEEQVKAAHRGVVHQSLGIGLDERLIDAVSYYKDFLLDWGFLELDFDVGSWVDSRPFEAALHHPEAA